MLICTNGYCSRNGARFKERSWLRGQDVAQEKIVGSPFVTLLGMFSVSQEGRNQCNETHLR